MSNTITIDGGKCNGCMICTEVCTLHNFEAGSDGKVHATEDGLACFSCGHCVAVCPSDAISHSELDQSGFQPLDQSARMPFDQFLSFLKLRRSRREFKADPVPREDIDKLLLAAVQAPSAINNQSVQYTVVTDRQVIRQISDVAANSIKKMGSMVSNPVMRGIFKLIAPAMMNEMLKFVPLIECMVELQDEGKDVILYDAPCVILLHAPKTDMCAAMDAVFNAENILLAVETLGLGACEIGFVTEPANHNPMIKKAAHIPLNHKVFSTIVVGYPKFKYSRTVPRKSPTVNYV